MHLICSTARFVSESQAYYFLHHKLPTPAQHYFAQSATVLLQQQPSALARFKKACLPACLLDDYMNMVSSGLSEVLRKHTYVGMADETLALLQHGTRLYLLNVAALSRDMFYQQVSRMHIAAAAAAAAAAACSYLTSYSPHLVCFGVHAPYSAATLPDR